MKMLQIGQQLETEPTLLCPSVPGAYKRIVRLFRAQPLARSIAVAPGVDCVKALVVVAVLLGGAQFAIAQDAAPPPAKPIKVRRSAPLALVPSHQPRTRPRAVAPPTTVPEQFSPPQEAYASFPDRAGAAVASGPPTPSACQARLAKLAVFKPLPMLVGAGECGAVDAVILDSIILPDKAKVTVSPPATLRCSMAEAVALWLREDVAPAALKLGAPLRSVDNFDSYECRTRNRVPGATLSEHGRANAIDVRAFKLANGKVIGLTDVNVARDWRDGIRASACDRFSTVLGPGSDGHHEEHIHMDLAERHGGYKMCEWDVREPVLQAQKTEPQADQATPLSDPVPLPRPRPVAANATADIRPRSGKTRAQ
jgi:hypothetical protein